MDSSRRVPNPVRRPLFDLPTAVWRREKGIGRIYTTDTDLLQFPGIEVINPLFG